LTICKCGGGDNACSGYSSGCWLDNENYYVDLANALLKGLISLLTIKNTD
jgi:hypothetical protein